MTKKTETPKAAPVARSRRTTQPALADLIARGADPSVYGYTTKQIADAKK
ncbi:MAG: hypothetical protein WBF53_12005 [Litorimonas sp.]